ncbi:MAG: tRNA pseudouridine(55) synthase TruB [bacterium]
MPDMDQEILLVDKPKGITSFDVIRRLRRELNIKKMGHAGTLDPLASGLMIIGINKGTKKLNEFIKLDKVYETEILLGVKTDTGDLEGKILETRQVEDIDEKQIQEVLEGMEGALVLPVPIYSAIKRGGEALYKKARRGEKIDPPKKEMQVYEIKLLSLRAKPSNLIVAVVTRSLGFARNDGTNFARNDMYILKLEIKVSSGTYIRSLAEEIGGRLGYPATVKELRRTQVGDFKIEDARKLSA